MEEVEYKKALKLIFDTAHLDHPNLCGCQGTYDYQFERNRPLSYWCGVTQIIILAENAMLGIETKYTV